MGPSDTVLGESENEAFRLQKERKRFSSQKKKGGGSSSCVIFAGKPLQVKINPADLETAASLGPKLLCTRLKQPALNWAGSRGGPGPASAATCPKGTRHTPLASGGGLFIVLCATLLFYFFFQKTISKKWKGKCS